MHSVHSTKPDDHPDANFRRISELLFVLTAENTRKYLFQAVSRVIEKYKFIEIVAISTIFFKLSTNFERNHIILAIFP